MFLFTNFIIFVLIWWILFFIFLPMNISVPDKPRKGHATSAPKKTYIFLKVIITTAISLIIMLVLVMINFDLGIMFKK